MQQWIWRYQAGICLEGGTKKVLYGKSYNNCLFQKTCVKFPVSLDKLLQESVKGEIPNPEAIQACKEFTRYYKTYCGLKTKCLAGELGSTAKYWTKKW